MNSSLVKTESRVARAFREPLNWFGGVLVAGATYLLTLSPVTALAAWAVYEAIFLLVVPQTAWLAAKMGTGQAAGRGLPRLLDEDARRYEEIVRLQREIAAAVPGNGLWEAEITSPSARLMERFLHFGQKRVEYHALLQNLALEMGAAPLDPFGRPLPPRGRERAVAAADLETLAGWVREGFDRRLADADGEMARESDPEGRALVQKRREVTEQLRASAEQVVQTARDVERQLYLVADTFRLIHAQLHSQPPEQLLTQVEEVVRSSRALHDALQELAPLEEQVQRPRAG